MIKQGDIAMIILVTAISLVAAYFISGALVNSPDSRSTPVEIAIPIDNEFPEPDKKIFIDNAINPTETIKIGEGKPEDKTNSPFKGN